ncbi:hypothetical protein FACS189472_10620 [Alphaproteobacteria bacterium]|nr:hypothetical protein FACS189472_10620 [Alphaproteobacteria bacterium]
MCLNPFENSRLAQTQTITLNMHTSERTFILTVQITLTHTFAPTPTPIPTLYWTYQQAVKKERKQGKRLRCDENEDDGKEGFHNENFLTETNPVHFYSSRDEINQQISHETAVIQVEKKIS